MSALAQQADTDQHLRVIISKMDIVHCTKTLTSAHAFLFFALQQR
jgi:hypothetical protein